MAQETNRITPEAVRNYNLDPAAQVVDKQSKYNPQLSDAARLKATADSLSKLAKGIVDVNYVMEKQANDNAIEAAAKTEEKNRGEWASVSKNLTGMAKFNPYNKEAYRKLRAKANMEDGLLRLAELEATCTSMNPSEFETQRDAIQADMITSMQSEGLKAKHTAEYLIHFKSTANNLTNAYYNKNAAFNEQQTHNQMVASTAKDLATMTAINEKGFLVGWNDAVKGLTDMANGLGIRNEKQYELFQKSVNQYLVDNIDEVDAEAFTIALGQTKINGKDLSSFDPDYATSMRQLLIKAKRAKYESDSIDLGIEKLRLEKAELAANAEMFNLLSNPNTTDAQILNKANELIEVYGMEAIGMDFLKGLVADKRNLYELRTTSTKPEVFENLMYKQISGDLTQGDILAAISRKQLSPQDASVLFNSLKSEERRDYNEEIKAIDSRYLADKAEVDLGRDSDGKSYKDHFRKALYEIQSNPNLSKFEKQEHILKTKKIMEHLEEQQVFYRSNNPMKLIDEGYLQKTKVNDISSVNMHRSLAKIGVFNKGLAQPKNYKITEDKAIKTYAGRKVLMPKSGKVVATGEKDHLGKFVLLGFNDGSFATFKQLQGDLPMVGTQINEGATVAQVGVNGALYADWWTKDMQRVNPQEFLKGKKGRK